MLSGAFPPQTDLAYRGARGRGETTSEEIATSLEDPNHQPTVTGTNMR